MSQYLPIGYWFEDFFSKIRVHTFTQGEGVFFILKDLVDPTPIPKKEKKNDCCDCCNCTSGYFLYSRKITFEYFAQKLIVSFLQTQLKDSKQIENNQDLQEDFISFNSQFHWENYLDLESERTFQRHNPISRHSILSDSIFLGVNSILVIFFILVLSKAIDIQLPLPVSIVSLIFSLIGIVHNGIWIISNWYVSIKYWFLRHMIVFANVGTIIYMIFVNLLIVSLTSSTFDFVLFQKRICSINSFSYDEPVTQKRYDFLFQHHSNSIPCSISNITESFLCFLLQYKWQFLYSRRSKPLDRSRRSREIFLFSFFHSCRNNWDSNVFIIFYDGRHER